MADEPGLHALHVLVDPEDATVDIVFVHGFTGHPVRTWSHKTATITTDTAEEGNEPEERHVKIPRLSSLPFRKPTDREKVYWPRHLLPRMIPTARVLMYGYDTKIRHAFGGPVSQITIYDIASDLLQALQAHRRLQPCRPLVFVAHSLGGIVVKEALRQAPGHNGFSDPRYRSIHESTVSIMFFGTPHGGADPGGLRKLVVEKVARAAGFSANEQIVNALLPTSERLQELRDTFSPMVVDDVSSRLGDHGIETARFIASNHMDMCRFSGFEDVGYLKVAAALEHLQERLARYFVRSAARKDTYAELDPGHRQILLDSLLFETIDVRFRTIKAAHTKTCEWLLTKPEYLEWLNMQSIDNHHGILWIKGKPGSGKSTLAKFLVATARRTMKDTTVVSFFFNARGEDLEKSTVGMYRSLIHQIMMAIPITQRCLDQVRATSMLGASRGWNEDELQDIFGSMIQSLGQKRLICFIDALDECDEDQIRHMIAFLERLGRISVSSKTRFQVCLSSRHYPHISIEKSIQITLELEEDHKHDITKYIKGNLKAGSSKKTEAIRESIERKSGGVFLWVALVVSILNKAYDQGRFHALERRLEEIPKGLDELFEDILARDQDNIEDFILCLQWILYTNRPLKREEIYYAIIAGNDYDNLSEISREDITVDDRDKFILSSSKGFAEVTKAKAGTVQFIHESVREFFLKKINSGKLQFELSPGISHNSLKECCERYLASDVVGDNLKERWRTTIKTPDGPPPESPLPKASTGEAKKLRDTLQDRLPFLDYATRNVLCHADAAQGFNVSQSKFLQEFNLRHWVTMDNILEMYEIRRRSSDVSMLYILAEQGLSNLLRLRMKLEPDPRAAVRQDDIGRYSSPLLVAIANATRGKDSTGTINALLGSLNEANFDSGWTEVGARLFREAIEHGVLAIVEWLLIEGSIDPNRQDHMGRTPLHYAARKSRYSIAELLLSYPIVQVDLRDKDGRTPLSYACLSSTQGGGKDKIMLIESLLAKDADPNAKCNQGKTPIYYVSDSPRDTVDHNNCKKIIEMLFDKGADVNAQGGLYGNALQAASLNGSREIVQLLLDKGADANAQGGYYGNALQAASREGHQEIVQLLLDKGADVNAQGGPYGNALQAASYNGSREKVQLLLDKGADVNAQGGPYGNALQAASYNGSREKVQLLLNKGVDVNTQGGRYGNALQAASARGSREVVKLLLDKGADVNAQGGYCGNALQAASREGHQEIVQLLLDKGADVNAQGGNYGNALQAASRYGHRELVQLLLDKGADVNTQGGYFGNALQAASWKGSREIVQLLLDKGADVNTQGGHFRSALQAALTCGHQEIVQLLRDRGAKDDINS